MWNQTRLHAADADAPPPIRGWPENPKCSIDSYQLPMYKSQSYFVLFTCQAPNKQIFKTVYFTCLSCCHCHRVGLFLPALPAPSYQNRIELCSWRSVATQEAFILHLYVLRRTHTAKRYCMYACAASSLGTFAWCACCGSCTAAQSRLTSLRNSTIPCACPGHMLQAGS